MGANDIEKESAELDALMRSVQRGDSRAFEKLYRRLTPRFTAVARRVMKSKPGEVGDAVNVAWTKIWQRRETWSGTNAFGWMRQIVVRTCLDLLRLVGPELVDPPPEGESPSVFDAWASVVLEPRDPLLAKLLTEGIEALTPESQRIAMTLHAEGLDHDEIAKATGVTSDLVRMRLFYARKKLIGWLAERGVQPS